MDSISLTMNNFQNSVANMIASHTTAVAIVMVGLIITVLICLSTLYNRSGFTSDVSLGGVSTPQSTGNIATDAALSEIQTGLEYKYMGYGQ